MSLVPSVINKLMLARHLFRMAEDSLKSHREVALYAAVNLMQDAVEVFLLAAAEHVQAPIAPGTNFDTYMTKIDEKIAPNQLPYRARLSALNTARVNARHYGIKPDRNEVAGFATDCRAFFEGSCSLLFGRPFWSVALLDLLEDGETKQLLANATALFDGRDYLNCLIECRRVMFVTFERNYDVEGFRDPLRSQGILSGLSNAPYYAQSMEYIERSVKEPFDYIVFDHQQLTSELIANGIDPQVFWNILRLSPAVYRYRKKGEWVGEWLVKHELQKEHNASEDHAAYVLEQTTDIVLTLEARRRLLRYTNYSRHHIRLKRDGVNIYERADRNSTVTAVTQPGLREVEVDASVPGLNDDSEYWHVSQIFDAAGQPIFLTGYVHKEDVDWSD